LLLTQLFVAFVELRNPPDLSR